MTEWLVVTTDTETIVGAVTWTPDLVLAATPRGVVSVPYGDIRSVDTFDGGPVAVEHTVEELDYDMVVLDDEGRPHYVEILCDGRWTDVDERMVPTVQLVCSDGYEINVPVCERWPVVAYVEPVDLHGGRGRPAATVT